MFYKGGSIIPKQTYPVGSSEELKGQDYVVYIMLDMVCLCCSIYYSFITLFGLFQNERANGTLYIDDYTSFNYEDGIFNYYIFIYEDGNVRIRSGKCV